MATNEPRQGQASAASAPETPEMFLEGLSAVIVEDEMIVSLLLEDMLASLGCSRVVHAASVSTALEEIAKGLPDIAVLDVNLGNEMVYPVAEQLNVAGVPFVFTTGYGRGAIKLEWAARPCVQKPFNIDAFAAALRTALGA